MTLEVETVNVAIERMNNCCITLLMVSMDVSSCMYEAIYRKVIIIVVILAIAIST